MTKDTINDAITIMGSGEGVPLAEQGTPMDRTIGDEPTLRPMEGRGGRGMFAPGDMIAGRYVIEKVLGEGGMGIVYQCLDKVGGVSVAVKCLPPDVSRNADEMEDIRANYRLVSDLHHPNIAGARTLEVDGSTGDYYLVMDLARGMSLKRWMRRNPQATMEAKLAILRQVAVALDYAHARKVIHRDVKPENVMVDNEGGVKVLDFGLAAQIRSSQSRTSTAVTSRGGTPGYKSPEQWRGKPQREPADVYSFGVMAYWMFAGELPFDGDDPVVLGHAVLMEPVEPIAGLPAYANAALAKALAKEPDERFASCGKVVDALEGKIEFSRVEHVARVDGVGGARRPAEPVGSRVPHDRVGGPRSRVVVKGVFTFALLVALMGGGYYGWMKYDEGVTARAAQQAEERARREKFAEEPIASPTEKDGVEAEAEEEAKRKAEAEEEAKRKAEAEEEEKRKAEAEEEVKRKAEAEEEAKRREAEEFTQLKASINRKVSAAKKNMELINAFRANPDGLEKRIDFAEEQWKRISAIRTPATLEEARSTHDLADKAEKQISLGHDWLQKNKVDRDKAKEAEAAITALLDSDVAAFRASRTAPTPYGEGTDLLARGQDAFRNGEFAEAVRLLGEARGKFVKAVRESKEFFVGEALDSAQRDFAIGKWQDCVNEADKVLSWEAGNKIAQKLKADAEQYLLPTANIVAEIEGREVEAKLKVGTKFYTTPVTLKLGDGKRYGPYSVSYESGGRRYYGTFDAVTVDWPGQRKFPVALKEYIGPRAGDTKALPLPGGVKMEMIYVAPGLFMMGSPEIEEGRFNAETRHRVRLTKGYWLGKYEVTQRQWASVMGDNPSRFKDADRPVENVSWEDCQRFIAKVNAAARRQFGGEARLPAEAEWEYACRAGTTGKYGGIGGLDGLGWYGENSGNETHMIGLKRANAWGFHDMHGNVWEWCQDWYEGYNGNEIDPKGPASGDLRVLRGGSWIISARFCRSAYRRGFRPDIRDEYSGFRLCCSAGLYE